MENKTRIYRFYEYGNPEVLKLESVETPQPSLGEVRVRISAMSLNRADLWWMQNNYVETPELPSKLGYEVCGTVEALGSDVTEFKVGDRVSSIPAFSISDYANFGETAILPTRGLMKTPDNFSFAQGRYEEYIVHGGDQGAISGTFMALKHPKAVKGLHTNMLFPRHPESPFGSGQVGSEPVTAAERQFAQAEAEMFEQEMAYIQTHITRPETLSVAMMDSPVGTASWIVEKYHSWADKRKRRFEDIFTSEQLLNEVMLYLVTDTFRTSLWTYAAFQTEPPVLPNGRKITVPTAVVQWQDTIHPIRPREFVERSIDNIVRWKIMSQGGHFPFYEERDRFVADLLQFNHQLRLQ